MTGGGTQVTKEEGKPANVKLEPNSSLNPYTLRAHFRIENAEYEGLLDVEKKMLSGLAVLFTGHLKFPASFQCFKKRAMNWHHAADSASEPTPAEKPITNVEEKGVRIAPAPIPETPIAQETPIPRNSNRCSRNSSHPRNPDHSRNRKHSRNPNH